MNAQHTPGPWLADLETYPVMVRSQTETWPLVDEIGKDEGCAGVFVCNTGDNKANARLIAAEPDLLEALQCFRAAHNMPRYGEYSSFTWAKSHMRVEGDPSWGWICERHGLGYQSGCICCRDDFVQYQERQDQNAHFSRDDALRDADKKACAAIEKATGEQK